MATKRFGLGRIDVTPSRRPNARSASDSNFVRSPFILIGGVGGRKAGINAEYPSLCFIYRPALNCILGSAMLFYQIEIRIHDPAFYFNYMPFFKIKIHYKICYHSLLKQENWILKHLYKL
jgi:hypothetical protein